MSYNSIWEKGMKGDESGKKNKGIYRWFEKQFGQVNPKG
jgi:hypothetical protein